MENFQPLIWKLCVQFNAPLERDNNPDNRLQLHTIHLTMFASHGACSGRSRRNYTGPVSLSREKLSRRLISVLSRTKVRCARDSRAEAFRGGCDPRRGIGLKVQREERLTTGFSWRRSNIWGRVKFMPGPEYGPALKSPRVTVVPVESLITRNRRNIFRGFSLERRAVGRTVKSDPFKNATVRHPRLNEPHSRCNLRVDPL